MHNKISFSGTKLLIVFRIFVFTLLFNSSYFAQINNLNDFFSSADLFFKSNVNDGLVNYDKISSDKTLLKELTNFIANVNLDELKDENDYKAFLINTYNLLVINVITEKYPINSPRDISGFFNFIEHKIGNEEYTLDEIEKQLLFSKYNDPRFHFVLVCAAVSCPEIINKAYKPMDIEEALNSKAKLTLNSNKHIKVDKENKIIYLSKIFDWYTSDFKKDEQSVIDFITQFRNEKISNDYTIKYLPYNWALNRLNSPGLNLQSLSPSALLPNGQFEIKIFNNLYTQTSYFNSESANIEQGNRSNFLTSIIAATYGYNSSVNFGIDAWFRSSSEVEESLSPFGLFGFNSNRQRTAISRVGPRIKFVPFKSGALQNVSIQSSFLIPTVSNLSGTNEYFYLDDDAYLFINQFLYDATLNKDLSLYAEFGIWMKLNKDDLFGNINYNLPLKLFVNYYVTSRLTFYAMNEFNYGVNSFNNSYFNQTGIGAKYLILPNMELEGLVTKFLFGKSSGAGSTFNLGIRLIY